MIIFKSIKNNLNHYNYIMDLGETTKEIVLKLKIIERGCSEISRTSKIARKVPLTTRYDDFSALTFFDSF